MKYLLLIHTDETRDAARTPAEDAALVERYFAAGDAMRAAGVYVASHRLRPTSTATTLRTQGGRTLALDGPFAETKEQFGGFYLIEVPGLDEALRWAGTIPAVEDGSVEVRPVWEYPEERPPA